MINIQQQRGSASTGLLTASAIYIGLLVYINFYAFNGQDNIAQTRQDDTPVAEQVVAAKDPGTNDPSANDPITNDPSSNDPSIDIVAPLSKGIFQSETIPLTGDANLSAEMEVARASSKSAPVELVALESVAQPSGKPVVEQSPVTTVDDRQAEIMSTISKDGVSAVKPETITHAQTINAPGYYHPGDVISLDAYNRLNSDLYYQQYTAAYNRAQGKGRGRGDMNGDGEFDFSMNFKSRGRMDADSDWDGDFETRGAGYHQGNNYYDTAAYPTYYQTYYSQY